MILRISLFSSVTSTVGMMPSVVPAVGIDRDLGHRNEGCLGRIEPSGDGRVPLPAAWREIVDTRAPQSLAAVPGGADPAGAAPGCAHAAADPGAGARLGRLPVPAARWRCSAARAVFPARAAHAPAPTATTRPATRVPRGGSRAPYAPAAARAKCRMSRALTSTGVRDGRGRSCGVPGRIQSRAKRGPVERGRIEPLADLAHIVGFDRVRIAAGSGHAGERDQRRHRRLPAGRIVHAVVQQQMLRLRGA